MADKNILKYKREDRRRRRVRGKVTGRADRPRLTVAKSLRNVFAQVIDDEKMETLVSASSNSGVVKTGLAEGLTKSQVARVVGEMIARLAQEKGITQVVFDRNRCRYHGRIKAVAEGVREGGLKV